jgi:putative transposase
MMSVAIMMDKGLSLRRALSATGISQGTYYYSPANARSDRGRMRDPTILSKIRDLTLEKPTYGTRMMAALLTKELKRPVNRKQVQHAYREMGWIKPQLTKNETLKSASDKIPKPTGINQLWQTDLMYIRCGIDGWGYLFSVLDVFSREWLAYVFDLLALKDNAIQAVVKAFEKHSYAKGHVTLYSDNGSQYVSITFRNSMKLLGIRHRFIAYNTPEQNAYIEAFHKTLKREYVWPYDFKSFQEAEAQIAYAFIDYNQRRPHSALGYMSPYEFVSQLRNEEEVVVN